MYSEPGNTTIISTDASAWGCRIYWLHLCRGVRPPPNESTGYDIKQSDGEASVMLDFGAMWNIPPLPLLPGPLWPRVIAPDRVLSVGQIQLFDM